MFQELQQDRTQKQLLSPLPFPTTLPLLSASVSSSKTVIVDPISYLQSFIKEMLSTIISVQKMPDYTGNLQLVMTLRYHLPLSKLLHVQINCFSHYEYYCLVATSN